ncbi:unnamed protein product [Darwinula stevensoni]|uniref:Uncharacterized protein n=1 Tax=Darwinula stevensoni TaxID=69355 RepID=A0A7R8XBA7_9CRUS|nr:unnamed protein product [Darwinula stevensoni]CAG0892660.1 unnamed protein product [Darwinula stevensoni]
MVKEPPNPSVALLLRDIFDELSNMTEINNGKPILHTLHPGYDIALKEHKKSFKERRGFALDLQVLCKTLALPFRVSIKKLFDMLSKSRILEDTGMATSGLILSCTKSLVVGNGFVHGGSWHFQLLDDLYRDGHWSEDATDLFEELSKCARWQVVMGKIQGYTQLPAHPPLHPTPYRVPLLQLVDTSTEKIIHRGPLVLNVYSDN